MTQLNPEAWIAIAAALVASTLSLIPVWQLCWYHRNKVFDIESICEEVPGSHHLGKSESSLEHPPRVHLNTRTWVLRRQATSGDGPPDYVAVVADSNRDRKLESVQIRKDILPMVAS